MKRVAIAEMLDEDRGTPQEVQDSLADLRMLNRMFGGTSTTTSLLRRVAQRTRMKQLSFLDVAGASGDIAVAAHDVLGRDGVELQSTVLDRALTHLPSATETAAVSGSALQLPFRDGSFDVVGCSLFLHHLEPNEIKMFLEEAFRVCRYAVIINDLRRSRLHWLAAQAGKLIYRSALTRHDAPASVRRAYTIEEMRDLCSGPGYLAPELSHHFFYRMGIILWRKDCT